MSGGNQLRSRSFRPIIPWRRRVQPCPTQSYYPSIYEGVGELSIRVTLLVRTFFVNFLRKLHFTVQNRIYSHLRRANTWYKIVRGCVIPAWTSTFLFLPSKKDDPPKWRDSLYFALMFSSAVKRKAKRLGTFLERKRVCWCTIELFKVYIGSENVIMPPRSLFTIIVYAGVETAGQDYEMSFSNITAE